GLAFLSRWRHRLLFVLLAVLAVLVMAGIFPVDHPSPFGRTLLFAYGHVPGAVGLRTTYKIGALLALAISILLGVGLQELRERSRPAVGRVAVAATALLLAANAIPLWSGGLYPASRTSGPVPDY